MGHDCDSGRCGGVDGLDWEVSSGLGSAVSAEVEQVASLAASLSLLLFSAPSGGTGGSTTKELESCPTLYFSHNSALLLDVGTIPNFPSSFVRLHDWNASAHFIQYFLFKLI